MTEQPEAEDDPNGVFSVVREQDAKIRELTAERDRLREALEAAGDAIDGMRMPQAKEAARRAALEGTATE